MWVKEWAKPLRLALWGAPLSVSDCICKYNTAPKNLPRSYTLAYVTVTPKVEKNSFITLTLGSAQASTSVSSGTNTKTFFRRFHKILRVRLRPQSFIIISVICLGKHYYFLFLNFFLNFLNWSLFCPGRGANQGSISW